MKEWIDGWGADEEGQTCLLPVMKPNIIKYMNSNALCAFPLSATVKTTFSSQILFYFTAFIEELQILVSLHTKSCIRAKEMKFGR